MTSVNWTGPRSQSRIGINNMATLGTESQSEAPSMPISFCCRCRQMSLLRLSFEISLNSLAKISAGLGLMLMLMMMPPIIDQSTSMPVK
jgi:hypothetical protein